MRANAASDNRGELIGAGLVNDRLLIRKYSGVRRRICVKQTVKGRAQRDSGAWISLTQKYFYTTVNQVHLSWHGPVRGWGCLGYLRAIKIR